MVVCAMDLPKMLPQDRLVRLAEDANLYYSFVNATAFAKGGSAEEAAFKDALEDWGYFGPAEKCPAWFGGYNYSQIELTHSQILQTWKEAARRLGIRIVTSFAPFEGRTTFIASLPDFGGPHGMLLAATYPPKFDRDTRIEAFAKEAGMFCSFSNAQEYAAYEEGKFKETLKHWGYFGLPRECPVWLRVSGGGGAP